MNDLKRFPKYLKEVSRLKEQARKLLKWYQEPMIKYYTKEDLRAFKVFRYVEGL
jgi:hypothetical protein